MGCSHFERFERTVETGRKIVFYDRRDVQLPFNLHLELLLIWRHFSYATPSFWPWRWNVACAIPSDEYTCTLVEFNSLVRSNASSLLFLRKTKSYSRNSMRPRRAYQPILLPVLLPILPFLSLQHLSRLVLRHSIPGILMQTLRYINSAGNGFMDLLQHL